MTGDVADYDKIMRALRNAARAAETATDPTEAERFAADARRLAQMGRQAREGRHIVQRTSGGAVIRNPDNSLEFKGDAFATSDHNTALSILEGAKPADLYRAGVQEDIVSSNPVASRATAAVRGVPFAGQYLDEFAGAVAGPEARAGVNAMDAAMQETRPGANLGYNLAGGLTGGAALGAALGPIAGAALPRTRFGKTAAAGAAGTVGGAVEGAVSGYGAGDDGTRPSSAADWALSGAILGGAMGAAAPNVADIASAGYNRLTGTPERRTAQALGVSLPAARALRGAVEADEIRSIPPRGMMADGGPTSAGMLDTIGQTVGPGARTAMRRVEDRAAEAGQRLTGALDDALGPAQGVEAFQRSVRQGSEGARSSAYNSAFAQSIDYGARSGAALKGLLNRVPRNVLRKAEELMLLNGETSAQFDFDDAGELVQMPDVRQWHYIKMALGDVADMSDGAGKLGGQTTTGNAYRRLETGVRNSLRSAVPDYAAASDIAGDAIRQVKAADFGTGLLSPRVTREQAVERLRNMEPAEVTATAQGLRSMIDDTLANVRAVASDGNMDARQAREALKLLSSPSSQDKIRLLLRGDADRVLGALEEAQTALSLRAQVATNSRTQGRREAMDAIDDMVAPGSISELSLANPVGAAQTIMQELTGNTKRASREKKQKILNEISDVLTRRGDQDGNLALRLLQRANRGQPLQDDQARFVAQTVTGASLLPAYQQGQNLLGIRGQ